MEADRRFNAAHEDGSYERLLNLARAYRAAAPSQHEQLLSELLTGVAAERPTALRESLLTWITDAPETDLATSPDYLRYSDLLPGALAGLLPQSDPDYGWFLSYLERCPACRDEFEQLAAASQAEDAAIVRALRAHTQKPADDEEDYYMPAVAEAASEYNAESNTAEERAAAIWRTGVQAALRPPLAGGLLRLAVEPRAPWQATDYASATGAKSKGPWIRLLEEKVEPDPDTGMSDAVSISAKIRKEGLLQCRLQIQVRGAGVHGHKSGIFVGARQAGAELRVMTNKAGLAELTLPIEWLPGLTISIMLPSDVSADYSSEE